MPLIEHDSKHLRRSSKGDDDFRLSAAPRPQKQKNGGLFGQRSTQSLKHLSTTTADQGKPWSFVCAQSSMIADTIEEKSKASQQVTTAFDFESFERRNSFQVDKPAHRSHKADALPPQTAQAIRTLAFLKEHLTDPFNTKRFTTTDIAIISQRHEAIVSVCKEWMRPINLAEINGMKLLIPPIYRFFQSGQVLAWIEVMATAHQLHKVLEIIRDLRVWLGRARTVGQSTDGIKKMDTITQWTTDVEYVIADYGTCLKSFPSEVYHMTATFLPQISPLRHQLEALSSLRNDPPSRDFVARGEREPFKLLQLPPSVISDPLFSSEDITRFTFSPKGSLLAFRGAHQVVVFSAFTGFVLCTFHFQRREPAFVAFSPGSTMLAVSFSNTESRLMDLRTGKIIQEVRDLPSATSKGHTVKRNNSISLGKDGKKLHTRHKSLDVGVGKERLNFAATYLDERTSAVGPDGVHALLTTDGVFKVSEEGGATLFFRRIRLEEGSPKSSLQRSLSALKRSWSGRQSGEAGQQMKKFASGRPSPSPVSGTSSKRSSLVGSILQVSRPEEVRYHCYDIETHEKEDVVIDKLMQKHKHNDMNSLATDLSITFNTTGTVAILHTTNALGAKFDVLHIANYTAKENPRLHIIYPAPPQSIAAFSASADGDLIALCPQSLHAISVVRLSQRQEIYRIDPMQLPVAPLIALSFVPGGSNTLMTAHSSGYAVFWDVKRLAEDPRSICSVAPGISWSEDGHRINPFGDALLLNRTADKSSAPLLIRVGGESGVRIMAPVVKSAARFDRSHHHDSRPLAIAEDGDSGVIGRYLHSFGVKPKSKKLSLPTKSHVVHSTVTELSTVALAVILQNLQLQVRVLNWSSRGGIQDWRPAQDVLNIWGLAFGFNNEFLGVGAQLRSDGLDKYAICILAKDKTGSGLIEVMRTAKWESAKPLKMAFASGGRLIVLTADRVSGSNPSYSTITFNVPSRTTGKVNSPITQTFTPCPAVIPAMSSEGDVFYLGTGAEEGWIMRLVFDEMKTEQKVVSEKVAWCPLSWRRIGSLSILCASNAGFITVVCMNKEFGIAAIKAQLPL